MGRIDELRKKKREICVGTLREENKIGPPYQLLTFLIMEILFFHVQNSLSNTEWQSVRKCTLLKFQYNNMFLKLCSNFV